MMNKKTKQSNKTARYMNGKRNKKKKNGEPFPSPSVEGPEMVSDSGMGRISCLRLASITTFTRLSHHHLPGNTRHLPIGHANHT